MMPEENYDSGFIINAEMHRFMVMTCLRCGAAVLHYEVEEGEVDPPSLHDKWHEDKP